MAILFDTHSMAMKRAVLTMIVMAPSKNTTRSPARSRLWRRFRPLISGKGAKKTDV